MPVAVYGQYIEDAPLSFSAFKWALDLHFNRKSPDFREIREIFLHTNISCFTVANFSENAQQSALLRFMAEDEGLVFYLVWGLGGASEKYFERKNQIFKID